MTSPANHGWLLAIALLPGCYFKDFELKDLSASGGAGGDAGGAGGVDNVPVPVTTAVCGQQALANPDLEEIVDKKAVGWIGETLPGFNVFSTTSAAAVVQISGSHLAWLGGYGGAYDRLSQTVKLPEGFAGATLSFKLMIDVEQDLRTTDELDQLFVDLLDENGAVFWRLGSFTNLDRLLDGLTGKAAWRQVDFEFPETQSLASGTFTLRFLGTTAFMNGLGDAWYFSNFLLDQITLTLNPC